MNVKYGILANCPCVKGQGASHTGPVGCLNLPFQSTRSPCRSPRVEHGGVEAGECHLRLETKATRVFVVSSDVRPGYCYTALTNGRCSNQLPQSITKMQCCCDAGRCWSPGVTVAPEMCPVRSTGKSPSVTSIRTQPFQARGRVQY